MASTDTLSGIYSQYQPTPTNTSQSTIGTSSLGKDAFLQLLVTQMQYQDPLNPSSDTEFIAQLAQFSSLEEMQNMNQQLTNSQASSLVGKNVIMKVTTATGETSYIGGCVDYVEYIGGKAYLSINDYLYSIDDLDSVLSDEYLESLKPPTDGDDDSEGNTETEDDSDTVTKPDGE